MIVNMWGQWGRSFYLLEAVDDGEGDEDDGGGMRSRELVQTTVVGLVVVLSVNLERLVEKGDYSVEPLWLPMGGDFSLFQIHGSLPVEEELQENEAQKSQMHCSPGCAEGSFGSLWPSVPLWKSWWLQFRFSSGLVNCVLET